MLLPSIFGNDFFDDFEKSFPLRMNWGRETDTLGGLMRADVKESPNPVAKRSLCVYVPGSLPSGGQRLWS